MLHYAVCFVVPHNVKKGLNTRSSFGVKQAQGKEKDHSIVATTLNGEFNELALSENIVDLEPLKAKKQEVVCKLLLAIAYPR